MYRWIEKSSANSEENPDIDGEAEAKDQRDVEELSEVGSGDIGSLRGWIVGSLGAGKGKEEEEEASYEFSQESHKVVFEDMSCWHGCKGLKQ